MSLLTPSQQKAIVAQAGMLAEKRFTVGTLSYTKGGLLLLFSWLMWNDLCLTLMENVAPTLVPFMLRDHGASNRDIAFFTSTLTGAFTIWINPVVSTWSDRYRGRLGRRRPFLLFAAPFCALFLAVIPFMPDLFAHLQRMPAFGHFFASHASFGVVAFIGFGYLFYQIFNSVITAIFTYYFWDVVPESVLGRFSAMTKVVSAIAYVTWNYFLFGQTEKHLKGVMVSVAAFFLVVYMITTWRVKEGEYPPPPNEVRPGIWSVAVSYFRDCYQPYYLWFIVANAIYQIGNLSGTFQMFFYRDQLHFSYDVIGKMKALPMMLVVIIGYPMGSLVDRVKPGRMMIISVMLYGITNVVGYLLLKGPLSLFFYIAGIAMIVCAMQISVSVFTVEFFPREKLGQFCSANATMYVVTGMILAPFAGRFFDWIKDYRYAFLWSASFYFLSVPLYAKTYLNWRRVSAKTGGTESQWQEPSQETAAIEA